MTRHNFYLVLALLGISMMFSGCSPKKQVVQEAADPFSPSPVSEIEQLQSTALLIDGSKQKFLGNFANAIVLYAEAAKTDPMNSAAHYELAKLHAQQGYLEDAEKFLQRALVVEPHNKYYRLMLADVYFLGSQNSEGLEVQKQLAQDHPTDLNVQVSLLSTFLYLEEFSAAIEVIDHIESVAGFNNELSRKKLSIFLEMERVDLAIEEARKIISYFPTDAFYLEILAELYNEAGEYEKAYHVLQRMQEIDPGNTMAHLLLADYYRKNDQEEKSFEHLVQAFESPQLNVEAKVHILLTYYFITLEEPEMMSQAWHLCEIMVEMHPDNPQGNAIYGDFLVRDQQYEKARDYYYRAAQSDPSDLGLWQQMLSINARLQDYESLLEISDEALEYFLEQPLLYFFKGLAHFQLNQPSQAIEALRYGKELAIDDQELLVQFFTLLGDSYYKNDDYSNAFESYEQALQLDPDNALALNNYSYYMSLRGVNLERAQKMSARSLELDPDNSAYQDTYGWINYKKGYYDVAEKWIKMSLENSETPSPVVLEHYGDVLYKLGDKTEALKYWEKARKVEEETGEEGSEFLKKKIRDRTLYE